MKLTEREIKIESDAIIYAKTNRTHICRKLTDKNIYLAEDAPVSVFMAGSPGAVKQSSQLVS